MHCWTFFTRIPTVANQKKNVRRTQFHLLCAFIITMQRKIKINGFYRLLEKWVLLNKNLPKLVLSYYIIYYVFFFFMFYWVQTFKKLRT